MSGSLMFPALFGALVSNYWANLVIFLVVLIGAYVLGLLAARGLRMPDYGWKLGLIFTTLGVALWIVASVYDPQTGRFQMPMGVDLKGGVILIYQVEDTANLADEQASDFQMGDLTEAVKNRINPTGTQEIVVRPYGAAQVEIIIPDVGDIEVERIKRLISTAGALEFRIVANREDHQDLVTLAEQQAQDPIKRRSRRITTKAERDGTLVDEMVAFWARVGREDGGPGGTRNFKLEGIEGDILRNARSGELLDLTRLTQPREDSDSLASWLERNGIQDIDILMATNDGVDVRGEDLGAVSPGVDEYLSPCINFSMKGVGASKFGQLTGRNLPDSDSGFHRRLGIVLDETLMSAPRIISRISDRGRITGRFTKEEVDETVNILRSGRLPATLQKIPISENQIGSMLGEDTIRRGKFAILLSFVIVPVFMLIYYRFSGLVACLALLANVLFVFATMILLKAPLTLPGLAGVVLTIGMAVDANVLIYERFREEVARGSGLRAAIRNGFSRAMSTIIDSNLTTIISGIVLYAIGTDQIRGFAVTLILGITMSMFTAIFCARVLFDIAERKRWISDLKMFQFFSTTHFDFMGTRRLWIAGSVVMIGIGLVAMFIRGGGILDIDFTGGTSVTLILTDRMDPETVRSRLDEEFGKRQPKPDYSVTSVTVEGRPVDSVFKVDTSLAEEQDLQQHLENAFRQGPVRLATYDMTVTKIDEITTPVAPAPPSAPAGGPSATSPPAETPPAETPPAAETPAPDNNAPAKEGEPQSRHDGSRLPRTFVALQEPAPAGTEPTPPPAEGTPAPMPPPTPPPAETPAATPVVPPAATPPLAATATAVRSRVELNFEFPVNAPTLLEIVQQAGVKTGFEVPDVVVDLAENVPDWTPESAAPFRRWTVELPVDQATARLIFDEVQKELSTSPVWESSSKIGSKVAGDTQSLALTALVASCLGIIAYVWLRFQNVAFGLAAVLALVHDVLVTLGAIALSHYLAPFLGFLMVDDFKVSLTVVAALLTIIGFSINDTIVIFDRIREIRGKSPEVTSEMVNAAVNQTLSRTLITSGTALMVVIILYVFGGQGIHGFAFALLVGMISGVYSTVFVASPLLLWMIHGRRRTAKKSYEPARSTVL